MNNVDGLEQAIILYCQPLSDPHITNPQEIAADIRILLQYQGNVVIAADNLTAHYFLAVIRFIRRDQTEYFNIFYLVDIIDNHAGMLATAD
jgi:hypothetical protein